ncbi:unnamed protein product [Meganyctiphanes norvegica]|uniref:Cyclin-dependent kinase inhibitor domain-containing protein n=1 Tax=Meganyctiphanes norvegica TaxID=48144 RepID=A0AAV2R592_MEGNR
MAIENIPPIVPRLGAALAPKSPSFRLKRPTAGGARRALSTLGNNNARLNLSMAQSLLTISQEGFLKKWNFDPVKEVPLLPGRYQWAPFTDNDKTTVAAPEGVAKDITMPNTTLATLPHSATTRVPDLHKTSQDVTESNITVQVSATKQISDANEVEIESEYKKEVISPSCDSLLVSTKIVSSKPQMCITDFLRPQKRTSSYLYDDCQSDTPSKKKLRTLH